MWRVCYIQASEFEFQMFEIGSFTLHFFDKVRLKIHAIHQWMQVQLKLLSNPLIEEKLFPMKFIRNGKLVGAY